MPVGINMLRPVAPFSLEGLEYRGDSSAMRRNMQIYASLHSTILLFTFSLIAATGVLAALVAIQTQGGSFLSCALASVVNLVAAVHYREIISVREDRSFVCADEMVDLIRFSDWAVSVCCAPFAPVGLRILLVHRSRCQS